MGRPSRFASSTIAIRSRHWSGAACFCTTTTDIGRPDARTIPLSISKWLLGSSPKSVTISITPAPASAMPIAIASNSSSLARKVYVGSPLTVR
jgi:hypothetical protein